MSKDVGELVRRVFSIQEERQAQYAKLKSAQEQYANRHWSLLQYQEAMEQVTRCFQTLSLEVIALNGKFRDELGLVNAASILEEIQRAEKEKLQLTVKLQVSLQREEEEASGEGEEFDPVAHDRREARKRLVGIEGAIAELLEDLRYECEPHLLQQTL